MIPTLLTLFALCIIGCGPPVNGQIQKDFKYLAKRPAAGSEFFRVRTAAEPYCVNVCVQNEDCQAFMYVNDECVGYTDGNTDGEDLAGAVAMGVIDHVDKCTSNPCLNGGVCTNRLQSYICGCPVHLNGTNCEIALTSFSLTCTVSSRYNGYRCEHALGSSNQKWLSDKDGTSAWIRVEMSGQNYITKLEIKSQCTNSARSKTKEVKLMFDDGSSQMFTINPLCYDDTTCKNAPNYIANLSPGKLTTAVKIYVTKACSQNTGWTGLQSLVVWGVEP